MIRIAQGLSLFGPVIVNTIRFEQLDLMYQQVVDFLEALHEEKDRQSQEPEEDAP